MLSGALLGFGGKGGGCAGQPEVGEASSSRTSRRVPMRRSQERRLPSSLLVFVAAGEGIIARRRDEEAGS